MRIQFFNEVGDFDISLEKIQFAVEEVLRANKIDDARFSLEVSFVDSKKMCELNKSFRGRNYATDVLSFPLIDKLKTKYKNKSFFVKHQSGDVVLLGDLVMCPEVIKKEAEQAGVSFEEQFLMLVSHGTKHLIGIHHQE